MARKSRKITWKDCWFEDAIVVRKRRNHFCWTSYFAAAYLLFKLPTVYVAAGWIAALHKFSMMPELGSIVKDSHIDETSKKFDPWALGFPSHGFAFKIIFFSALGIFNAATLIIGDYKGSKRLLKSWTLYSFLRSLFVILKCITNVNTMASATKFDKYPLTDLVLINIIENIVAKKVEDPEEEDEEMQRSSVERKLCFAKKIFSKILNGVINSIQLAGETLCVLVALNEWFAVVLGLYKQCPASAVCAKTPLLLE